MYYKSFIFKNQDVISSQLSQLCKQNKYDVYGVYHPENSYDILKNITEFFEDAVENNIWQYVKGFGINVINPGKNNFVHIDPWFSEFSRYRLIFPIQGTKGSSVAFYKSSKIPDQEIYIKNHLDDQKTFKYFSDESHLIEIAKVSTETPTVIDTQTLHSAQNPGNNVRIIAMIGLDANFDLYIESIKNEK